VRKSCKAEFIEREETRSLNLKKKFQLLFKIVDLWNLKLWKMKTKIVTIFKKIHNFLNNYMEKNNEENGDIIDKSMTRQHF